MTNSQDFERLSAYIDNALPPAEKAALEARLAREPELQATLRDLRLTVRALRSLPQVQPPRSFTLRPEQVGGVRARRAPWFATLRLATALSAVLLVFVLTADFAASRSRVAPMAAPAEPTQLFIAEQAEATLGTDGLAAPPAPEATPLPPTEPAAELMATTNEAATEEAATEEMISGLQVDPSQRSTAAIGAAGEVTPTPPPPTPSPQPTATLEPPATEAPKALDATRVAEADAGPPPDEGEALVTGASGAQQEPPAAGLSTLRVAEIALAMLTVLLGLGAWLARRNA